MVEKDGPFVIFLKLFAKNPKNTKWKIRKSQSKKSEKHKIKNPKNTKQI